METEDDDDDMSTAASLAPNDVELIGKTQVKVYFDEVDYGYSMSSYDKDMCNIETGNIGGYSKNNSSMCIYNANP